MPRLQPAPGYITAKEALSMLNISDATLSQYVKRGWLKRYGPPERVHKFYKLSEVEAIIAARHTFDEYQYQEGLSASFGPASIADLPSILDIDERTFNIRKWKEPREEYLQQWTEIYLRWMSKNPQAFSVLRDAVGRVIGYSIFLPIKQGSISRFVNGEIGMSDIPIEDIDLFEPGRPLHVYVVALAVDPVFRKKAKRGYGAHLIHSLFGFVFELARAGIEIEAITARTYTADGKQLLHNMGMTHLRSPVPDIELYSIRVAESGFWALVRYSDLLAEWKREQQEGESGASIVTY